MVDDWLLVNWMVDCVELLVLSDNLTYLIIGCVG